jgi:hypothetical protein
VGVTILDANGHPLSVGMRVKWLRAGWTEAARVKHIGTPVGGMAPILIEAEVFSAIAPRRTVFGCFQAEDNTYRCPDLKAVLTPDPEEKR